MLFRSNYDYLFKVCLHDWSTYCRSMTNGLSVQIVLIGDSGVGKTNRTHKARYTQHEVLIVQHSALAIYTK